VRSADSNARIKTELFGGNATPGVVMTSAELQSAPADDAPDDVLYPFSRFTRIAVMTSQGSRPRGAAGWREYPTTFIVGRSSGNSPATPRIPSVPKSLSIQVYHRAENEMSLIQYWQRLQQTRTYKYLLSIL
jgi:hypothetical protein